MKRLLLLLCGFAACTPASALGAVGKSASRAEVAAAISSLANARRAQTLLGPELWSRVVRIENTTVRSRYPETIYALVFEQARLLWFYTDTDGTQSLTLHPDRLVEEKADLAPLLRAIEAGFVQYEIVSSAGERTFQSVAENGPGGPFSVTTDPLPNACFIASLAALADCVRRGGPVERARLLNCYVDTPGGRRGHTVLTYETPAGLFLLDPGRSPNARSMPRAWADNALALAGAALPGSRVARARWVPTAVPLAGAALVYADFTNDSGEGTAARLMR